MVVVRGEGVPGRTMCGKVAEERCREGANTVLALTDVQYWD